MTFDGDFHMHTRVSDGRVDVRDLAAAARAKGLKQICITDHSFSGLSRIYTLEKFRAQAAEIEAERDITISQGVEANILNEDGALDISDQMLALASPLIAGFHRFWGLATHGADKRMLFVNGYASERERQKLKDVNTRAILKAIERYPIDVIVHIGHRFPLDFVKVAEACAARGTYIEFNERHILQTFGLEDKIDDIVATGVKFIVGSDSHKASKVGEFPNVTAFLQAHSIPLDRVCGIDGNMPVFKGQEQKG